MIKKCCFFSCLNKDNCAEPNCTGCGGTAYQNCGCDVCAYQSFIGDGDVEICDISLCLREADMEEG